MRTDIAVEKLCDIAPIISELAEKLSADEEYKSIILSAKGNLTNKTFVFNFLPMLLKKYNAEIYNILAVWSDKTVEEIKGQSFAVTVKEIKGLFADEDFKSFFSSSAESEKTQAE